MAQATRGKPYCEILSWEIALIAHSGQRLLIRRICTTANSIKSDRARWQSLGFPAEPKSKNRFFRCLEKMKSDGMRCYCEIKWGTTLASWWEMLLPNRLQRSLGVPLPSLWEVKEKLRQARKVTKEAVTPAYCWRKTQPLEFSQQNISCTGLSRWYRVRKPTWGESLKG